MWELFDRHFSRFPAQARVARVLLKHGFAVREGGVYAGPVALTDTALARAASVDRRVVTATVETIDGSAELRRVFSRLIPTCHLREAAAAMGWGVIEIVPTNASRPGILASVTEVIARHSLSVRQAIVEDPDFAEEPRLYIITETRIPAEVLPEIQAAEGVKEVVIGR